MMINVFGHWLEPTGIRLAEEWNFYTGRSQVTTSIIFGAYSMKNEFAEPMDTEYKTYYDSILIEGRTADEVAAEINRKLKELA